MSSKGFKLRLVIGWMVGVMLVISLPLGLVWAAYVLVRKGRDLHHVRLVIGWVFIVVGILGLFDLPSSAPHWGSTTWRRYGGALGAVVGRPSRAYLHPAGAAVVFWKSRCEVNQPSAVSELNRSTDRPRFRLPPNASKTS